MSRRVTRHVEFETAHLLEGYNGRCSRLHGHSYALEITVCGEATKSDAVAYRNSQEFGFCMDFKALDQILNDVVPDHLFVANEQNLVPGKLENDIVEVLKKHNCAYELMPCAPSAENMVDWIVRNVQDRLPKGLAVVEAKLWETADSYASWPEKV